jgi:hypothetical protein
MMQLNKWQGQWFLHHDNTPSHTSLVVQQFFAKKNIPVITQPSYSPDLAPNDIWLVPTLKMGLKRDTFHNHGGHQIEYDGRAPEDSKTSLPLVLPTMAGVLERVGCGFGWGGRSCLYISTFFCTILLHM